MTAQQPRFKICVRLADRVKGEGGKLSRYPDIDESERERLEWSVSGQFGIFDGDRAITMSEFSDSGFIDDYVWRLLIGLHSKLPEIVAGENVDQPILDNPGRIHFYPLNDDKTRVIFDPQRGDHVSSQETTVDRTDISDALVSASKDLIEQLLDLNTELRDSALVIELEEAIREAE